MLTKFGSIPYVDQIPNSARAVIVCASLCVTLTSSSVWDTGC